MIPLTAHKLDFSHLEKIENIVKLDDKEIAPPPLRKKRAYVCRENKFPEGYNYYITFDEEQAAALEKTGKQFLLLEKKYDYLTDSDIIRLSRNNSSMRVLFRKKASSNYFLLTERCNHLCLMCSQPPKNIDDSHLAQEVLETIPLIDINTPVLGFSGGEPTLLGDMFFKIMEACKNYLPKTKIHILSNGRAFVDPAFTARYAALKHPHITLGIPIYSDVSSIHDYVVQADNAFDETVRGILNLKRLNQRVEIRVVIHKQTYQRLPQLATFIARNLAFIDHVALMGLEITGFTKANMKDLLIDPYEYKDHLKEAVDILSINRMNVSVYNHQLCTISADIWPFAKKSISDWKNEYLPECEGCSQKSSCGGFFTTQLLSPSKHIKAFG